MYEIWRAIKHTSNNHISYQIWPPCKILHVSSALTRNNLSMIDRTGITAVIFLRIYEQYLHELLNMRHEEEKTNATETNI